MKFKSALFMLLMLSQSAYSKKFASQFCEFQLPPKWECALEGTEWVCQSENKNRKKEAIIILAAKRRGSQDTLDQYQAYLKRTKTFRLPGGKTQVSEPKFSRVKGINDHRWVDSLHMASEVPGFYTRYLATVKGDIGVAVTFSVAKDHYGSYQELIDQMVSTLRVFAQANMNVSKFKLKDKADDILRDTTFIPDENRKYDIGQRKKGKAGSGGMGSESLMYLLGLAAVGFLFMKMKKGGKKKSKGTKKKKKVSKK